MRDEKVLVPILDIVFCIIEWKIHSIILNCHPEYLYYNMVALKRAFLDLCILEFDKLRN